MLSQWHLVPDLKEGECCPLQETLGIANFSVEFLWGENHTHIQYITHTYIYLHSICNELLTLLPYYSSVIMMTHFSHSFSISQNFTDLLWSFWKNLTSCGAWLRKQKSHQSPVRLLHSIVQQRHTLYFFAYLVSYKSVTHPLSSKEGTLSWSYHKVLTVR